MIYDFYTKPLQVKLFRLFQNLILNLREEDITYMTNSETLVKMEARTENHNRAKAVKSALECVVKNKEPGSLNTVNLDIGSEDINRTVDTLEIILCVKLDLWS